MGASGGDLLPVDGAGSHSLQGGSLAQWLINSTFLRGEVILLAQAFLPAI